MALSLTTDILHAVYSGGPLLFFRPSLNLGLSHSLIFASMTILKSCTSCYSTFSTTTYLSLFIYSNQAIGTKLWLLSCLTFDMAVFGLTITKSFSIYKDQKSKAVPSKLVIFLMQDGMQKNYQMNLAEYVCIREHLLYVGDKPPVMLSYAHKWRSMMAASNLLGIFVLYVPVLTVRGQYSSTDLPRRGPHIS